MTENQQEIIYLICKEIANALASCEHGRHDEGSDRDKIESLMDSYDTRARKLRSIREQLENEFTIMHYDPR